MPYPNKVGSRPKLTADQRYDAALLLEKKRRLSGEIADLTSQIDALRSTRTEAVKEFHALPSLKKLADQLGVSVNTVKASERVYANQHVADQAAAP